jgi:hypothetical protein
LNALFLKEFFFALRRKIPQTLFEKMEEIPINDWIHHPDVVEHYLTMNDLRSMKKGDKVNVLWPTHPIYRYTLCYTHFLEGTHRPTKIFKEFISVLSLHNTYDFKRKHLHGSHERKRATLCAKIDNKKWEKLPYGPTYREYIDKFPNFVIIGYDEHPIVKLDKEEYLPNVDNGRE